MGRRVSSPALVGREVELDVLTSALAGVAVGRPATVVVTGEAGIGKSRLVAELADRARAGGGLVATGACVPSEVGGLPLGPVVGLVRDLLRQSGDAAPALAPLAAALGLGGSAEVGARAAPSRALLFETVLAAVAVLARERVAVLVVEDVQWSDSASRELVDFLTRNLVDEPVLLVVTHRSGGAPGGDPVHAWATELARHPRSVRVQLEALDLDGVAGLVGAILGPEPDSDLVTSIWVRSGGNPFFAEALAATGGGSALPADLRHVLLAAVDALSPGAARLARIVAVAGDGAGHGLLVATGLLGDALDAAAADAVGRQVLVVDDAGAGYGFRHALLREAVLGSLLPGERARLHGALACALSSAPALAGGVIAEHLPAVLARHWWGAGAWSEALLTSVAAAEAATGAWAFVEAHAHLERALSALDRLPADAVPPDVEHLHLLELAAGAAFLAGAGEAASELATRAVALAEVGADDRRTARALLLLGRVAWSVGRGDAALAAVRRAAGLLAEGGPTPERAMAHAAEASTLMVLSRFRQAKVAAERAIAAAVAAGARTEEGHARNTLGVCLGATGHVEEGLAELRRALAIAEEVGSAYDVDRAYANLSYVLLDAGRLEDTLGVLGGDAGPAVRRRFLQAHGAASNVGEALVRLGRWEEADQLLIEMGDRGLGVCSASPHLLRALVSLRRGAFDAAHAALALAEEITAELGDAQIRGSYHAVAAELALEQGRIDAAAAEVDRALTLTAGTDETTVVAQLCVLGVRTLADQVVSARAAGRRVDIDKAHLRAGELVGELQGLISTRARDGGVLAPQSLAQQATCEAERSRLHTSDPDRWADAAERWEASSEPHAAASCRWREAEALLVARGGRGRAGASLERAWETATRLGAAPLVARIEDLARRARIPLEHAATTPPAPRDQLAADLGLTPREVEVLTHLAAGRTDREIADALYISKKTASVHVSNLLRKLGAANRVEAGGIARSHDLGG